MTRWQDDPVRAPRIHGRLRELTDARIRLEAAVANLDADDIDEWWYRRQVRLVAAARKGLDGAIGMALFDDAAPPMELIAEAAGVDLAHVEVVQARLLA